MCVLSLALGTRAISPGAVFTALTDPSAPFAETIRGLRVPRTLTALAAGAALGLAGTVMQGVTRNPLADPGLLGVNAGASLLVVTAITWLGISSPVGFVWFAFAGAAVATVVVYAIASRATGGATPFRLALAGAAVTAAGTSLVTLVLLTSRTTLDQYRFWSVGSLANPDTGSLLTVLPFLLVGAALALGSGRTMNALALGEDAAVGLGQDLRRAKLVMGTAIVLLCGSATALAGPIAFVGLTVAHIARRLAGGDYRWVLPLAATLGPALLLGADVLGRLVARPGELEAGIVVAFLGAPVMIGLVRRGQVPVR
ncbi:iron complex transport system permease protein [Jatrophihabitans endophyticus]|uniref:Iron complex transport system permease protein n=2 Tax=Jatrophihabitans endophyticus TaxID=1206085 RepID=A0A1M5GIK8_9ACTN|nr:iron chelate uptake ABC transporter family permease subunit [Jatrophihabitans endophyticus]SHG03362.1 iron complex transport system permease protein [Jatrophihabitans endophyticus]